MWILTIIFSWISDYISTHGLMSSTVQRKIWNSIAHWGGALALLSLYLFDTSVTSAMILLTVALGLNSGILTGFMTNHLELAPNFAGTLMGITNSLSNVTSILGPLLVGFIVTDNVRYTHKLWKKKLYLLFLNANNHLILDQQRSMGHSVFMRCRFLLLWKFILHYIRNGWNSIMERFFEIRSSTKRK